MRKTTVSCSVCQPWTEVPVSCLGNQHMPILRATVVTERAGECGKGKSHKDPLVNLMKVKGLVSAVAAI